MVAARHSLEDGSAITDWLEAFMIGILTITLLWTTGSSGVPHIGMTPMNSGGIDGQSQGFLSIGHLDCQVTEPVVVPLSKI